MQTIEKSYGELFREKWIAVDKIAKAEDKIAKLEAEKAEFEAKLRAEYEAKYNKCDTN